MGRDRRAVVATLVVAVFVLGAGAAVARAQGEEAEPPRPDPQTTPESQVDVFDVARRLFKKAPPDGAKPAAWNYQKLMFTILPTVGYKPSTGFTVGATSNLAKFFGDPATTRISSAVVGLSVSTKKQTSFMFRFGLSGKENRWRLDGDNRFQWTSQDSFGLGMTTAPADAVNTRFTYVRVFDTAWAELPKDFFAGVGFHYSAHTNIRPGVEGDPAWDDSAYVTYSQAYGFDLYGQSSVGFSLNLMHDTRDNPINASRGSLASIAYRPFVKNLFGGDSTWQEVSFDVRSYFSRKPDARHRLAVWVFGDLRGSGTVPYFDLPALGMDAYGRSGRGYTEARFRGERFVYGEVEYRATLTRNGLLGMVAFLNSSTASDEQTGEKLFGNLAAGGGVGLRVLFSKRSSTNLCVDVGWGRQGSRGLYLGLQEAF